MSRPLSTAALLLLAALDLPLATAASAQPDAAAIAASVAELGGINGQALACGHLEIVGRAKRLVIARVAKTRALGEAFETGTNDAFRQQTADKAACPPAGVLALRLEAVAQRLGPPVTHRLDSETETPQVGINPRYLLQDINGRAFMDGDFPRHFQLITFGYTFCPDICPTTLIEMAEILKQLDAEGLAAQLQPLFISVDPERDTLAVLRQYTSFFDPRILGATASAELVRRAAENFKVRYEKVVEPGAAAGHYAVDHTAGMYLLAPGGQFLARFPYGTPAADIAARIADEIKRRAPAEASAAKGEAATTAAPAGDGAVATRAAAPAHAAH